jgi:uncharacterized protein YqhQ
VVRAPGSLFQRKEVAGNGHSNSTGVFWSVILSFFLSMCVFCYFQVFIVLFPAGVCVRMVEENCGVWFFIFYIYILMLNFLIKRCYI